MSSIKNERRIISEIISNIMTFLAVKVSYSILCTVKSVQSLQVSHKGLVTMKNIILIFSLVGYLQGSMLESGTGVLSLKGGLVTVDDEKYSIAGINVGYFLLDGLKIGLAYERWFEGEPSIDKLSVDSNYYLPVSDRIRPYLGAFYAQNYASSEDIGSSYGFRGGVLFYTPQASIGLEWTHETYDRCSTGCERSYPMVVFGFSF